MVSGQNGDANPCAELARCSTVNQVNCCCTQARNALGVLSLLCEALDAGLALHCGSDLYLARRALGDCITLGR